MGRLWETNGKPTLVYFRLSILKGEITFCLIGNVLHRIFISYFMLQFY